MPGLASVLPVGQWHLVGISVLMHLMVFGLFIAGTQVRGKVRSGRAQGAFVAFIVALYAEMYGVPLTVYLLAPVLGFSPVLFYPPPLGLRLLAGVLVFAGFLLVYLGWREVHRAGGRLVTTGIYHFMRHPQYVGLWLMTLSLWLQWPTLIALLLWPLLAFLYYTLALAEERAMQARFPEAYTAYAARVPRFLPRLSVAPGT